MSEEKKEAYEVGIPLDELPPQETSIDAVESSVEDEIDPPAPGVASEPSDDASGLPDLFDPEELAEVGLTADLTESVEVAAEDDSPSPPGHEDAAVDEKPEETTPHEEDDAGTDDLMPESLTPEPAGGDIEPEDPAPAERQSAFVADEDEDQNAAETNVLAVMDAEEGPDDETPAESGAYREDTTIAPSGDDAFLDPDLLMGRLESLSLQIGELQREFEGKLKYDAHKDEIIDRLHSELQEYKQDIIKKYVLAIVMDVVKVADDIRKWLAYFRSLEVSQRDPRKLFRYLEAIPSDLEDVFYWHGVKPFSHEEGAFDPARQRAIKKIPTDDPALDKSVAHSIRPGYEWETKVIRQEMVAVYVYQEEQESLDTGMIDE